jgi:predicted acetyltransferase
VEIRALRPSELEQAWELERDAFQPPESRREVFLRIADPAAFVGAFESGRLLAVAGAHAMGQYFGGRAVPMAALASVSVVPDRRGEGLARQVTAALLPILRGRGAAISTLYPATTSLYRGLGWELGGLFCWSKLAPGSLAALPAPARGSLRRAEPAELSALRACYDRVAACTPGFLARSDAWWQRLASIWQGRSLYAALGEGGGVDGYLVYAQQEGEYSSVGGPRRILASELVAATRDAALALWRLLGGWSTQVSELVLLGAVDESLLFAAPEQALEPLAQIRWLTRIVDAPAAVAARGFSDALELELPLALRDPQLPHNDGAFVLRVGKGQGELARAARAPADAPSLEIGGFASLYTGFAQSARLDRAGLLTGGSPAQRAALDAAFAGAAPVCQDEF